MNFKGFKTWIEGNFRIFADGMYKPVPYGEDDQYNTEIPDIYIMNDIKGKLMRFKGKKECKYPSKSPMYFPTLNVCIKVQY